MHMFGRASPAEQTLVGDPAMNPCAKVDSPASISGLNEMAADRGPASGALLSPESGSSRAALAAVLESAVGLVGASRVLIILDVGGALRLVARRGFSQEAARALADAMAGPDAQTALNADAVLAGSGLPRPVAEWQATHGEREFVLIPLPGVGACALGFAPPARVTDARIEMARQFGRIATLALAGVARAAAARRDPPGEQPPMSAPPVSDDQHLRFIHGLTDALMATVAAGDTTAAADAATDIVLRSMPGIDVVNVWLVSDGGHELQRVVTRGAPDGPNADNLPLEETVGAAHALREGRVLVWEGAQDTWPERLQAFARDAGLRTVAHVPMHSGGRVLGVFTLGSRAARVYTALECSFLATLAGQLGGQIDAAHGQRRVEAEQRRLTSVIETLPLGLIIVDADGRVSEHNSTAAELVGEVAEGYPWDQLVPRVQAGELVRQPHTVSDLPLARALRGQLVRADEIVIRNEEGVETPLLVTAGPIRDADGSVAGAICAFQDISHLKELDRLKDDFINTVSHELRTPTTTIRGGALTLLRRGDRLDDETRRELLQDIVDESERLNHLLEDLLSLSRSRSGMQISPEPLRVQRLVNKAVLDLGARLGRCTLSIDLPHDLPLVDADPLALEQVVRNLLQNAAKYSPRGGRIEVTAQRVEDELQLTVADRGTGIAAAELERVFEPFFRSSAAVEAGAQGAGLGLAVCRRLVELCGGRIWAEPRRGGGMAFHFTVPVVDDSAED
jgi:PAS domain S-box-containing protein